MNSNGHFSCLDNDNREGGRPKGVGGGGETFKGVEREGGRGGEGGPHAALGPPRDLGHWHLRDSPHRPSS